MDRPSAWGQQPRRAWGTLRAEAASEQGDQCNRHREVGGGGAEVREVRLHPVGSKECGMEFKFSCKSDVEDLAGWGQAASGHE